MRPLTLDLSGFTKLNLESPPVGVKFLYHRPEGIPQLDKQLALCEMLPEAQKREKAFYIRKENENCFGKQALGMTDAGAPPFAESGEMGVKLGVFQDARANQRLAIQNPCLPGGTVHNVVFASLPVLDFDPDLLVVLAEPRKS